MADWQLLGSQPRVNWGMAADVGSLHAQEAARWLTSGVVAVVGCAAVARRYPRSPSSALMLLFFAEVAARMLFPAEEPYWEYARELRLVLMLAAVSLLTRITNQLYVVRVVPILTAIGVWLLVKLSWIAGGVSVDGVGGSSDLGRRAALAVGLNLVFPLAFAIPLLIWDVKERSARPGVFLAVGVALGIVGVVLQRAAEGDTLFFLGRAAAFQMSWLASGAAFGLAGCEAVQSLAKRRWALGVGAGAVALGITVMPVLKAWTYYLGGWMLFE